MTKVGIHRGRVAAPGMAVGVPDACAPGLPEETSRALGAVADSSDSIYIIYCKSFVRHLTLC